MVTVVVVTASSNCLCTGFGSEFITVFIVYAFFLLLSTLHNFRRPQEKSINSAAVYTLNSTLLCFFFIISSRFRLILEFYSFRPLLHFRSQSTYGDFFLLLFCICVCIFISTTKLELCLYSKETHRCRHTHCFEVKANNNIVFSSTLNNFQMLLLE